MGVSSVYYNPLQKYNTFTGISQGRSNRGDSGVINREHIIQTQDKWPSVCTCSRIIPNSPRICMNRCKISICRCIPLLSFKSERETKQENVVATLPCENALYIEIVVLFSKNQHICIASHKRPFQPLSLKLSCHPATRSLVSNIPHKHSFI